DHINLVQSFDGTFGVLDANGTDGAATFKLPAPGTYQIWARAVGTPGGWAKVLTCAADSFLASTVCTSPDQTNYIYTPTRTPGKSTFQNVTAPLTTISLDAPITCNDGTTLKSTISLFDPCLINYFWQYTNNGLRVLQIRFYYQG